MIVDSMRFFILTVFLPISFYTSAQSTSVIRESEVRRIENILASDEMQGRKVFTPGIEKAASFIVNEFQNSGLKPLNGSNDFKQTFTVNVPVSTKLYNTPDSEKVLTNLVGIIPGRSRPEEYVIFSAHYDHLGIGRPDATGDSIYNGANDDASGVTAILTLARYFHALNSNERTIVFIAFTAEEPGGLGSNYFSTTINPEKVVAMFNIEMIGTESKWGKNSAYITGYDKSDLGEIMQKNLKSSSFKFYPDPYPEQYLFLRSDNASLAKIGVPAHTISTSRMDTEKFYHSRKDETSTLDMQNMTEIIRAIGQSADSIISGRDTPRRLVPN
jgi:Zn-dependent M28 family amino/carboxypeptidase